ncbi:MAG TPA: hypothetical protein VHZ96_07145, partial [Frankiaceae bacterium]|nr:hypothetical protein [Frankiaceae bacterium]
MAVGRLERAWPTYVRPSWPVDFGVLDFFDGVPLPWTVSKAYDALDLMRGIEVFLNAVPGASLVAMRRGLR